MKYRLLILLATIIWGSSFVVVKDATETISPAWLLFVRFTMATIVLAIVLLGHRKEYFRRENIGYGILIGTTLFFGYYFQTIGITDTTPGKNAFLTGVYCVLVPFVAWLFMHKRPNRFNIIAAFMCLVGIGFISFDGSLTMSFGDAMSLIDSIFYALQIVLIAKFAFKVDMFALTIWQFATVAVLSLICGVLFEQAPDFATLPTQTVWAIVYLGIPCSALALLLQNIAQANIPPASASLLLSLESVFGAAFSVAFGAEELTVRLIIGFVVVFAAIMVSEVLPEKFNSENGVVQK